MDQLSDIHKLIEGKFNYAECPKGGAHKGEKLSFVCVDQDCKICKESGVHVICTICAEELHQGQNIKPIKIILNEAYQEIQQRKGESSSTAATVKQIQQLLFTCRNALSQKIHQKQKEISQIFKAMQNKIEEFYDNEEKKLSTLAQSSKVLETQFKDVMLSIHDTSVILNPLKNIIQFLDKKDKKNKKNISQVTSEQLDNLENDYTSQYNNFSEQLKQSFCKIDKTLVSFQDIFNIQSCSTKYTFAPSTNPTVQISNQLAKCIKMPLGYRLCLIEPVLSQTIKLKINGINKFQWMAVGVCDKSQINPSNLVLTKLNHGCYLSSSNGATWHSQDATINNQPQSFKWGVGDILEIEKKNDLVKIKKSKTEEEITWKLTNMDLHACVILYCNQDEIEILND